MEIMKLSDIATISAGQSAPQGDECYTNDGIPFVKAGNLSELIEHNDENQIQKVSEKTISDYKLKLYPKGTILFAKSGMSCMKGLVYVLKQDCYVVSHLACITPLNIESDYLKYYFEYHKPNTLVKDESYPSISLKDIGDMTIKVFNAEKRKEIIENLNKLNILINKNKSLLKKYDELVKSQFIEMFGDRFDKEKIKISDIASATIGLTYKPENVSNTGTIILRSGNIQNNELQIQNDIVRVENIKIPENKFIKENDILMCSRNGSARLVGKSCLISNLKEPISFGAFMTVIRTEYPYFLQGFFCSDYFKKQLTGVSTTSVNQITTCMLNNYSVIRPTQEEENQFADFVKHIDKLKFTIKQSIEKLNLCYQSLMKEYFE